MIITEIWKPIPEQESYFISSWGRIWSDESQIFLRPYIHKSRNNYYWRSTIKGKKYINHLLMGHIFMEKEFLELQLLHPDKRIQMDHLDTNTLNNNLNNFEWVTESVNKIRMHRNRKSFITFNSNPSNITF